MKPQKGTKSTKKKKNVNRFCTREFYEVVKDISR